MKPATPKLAEIARRILAHLKRFESDPEINKQRSSSGRELTPYYSVNAYASGSRVGIRYVSFRPEAWLTKAEALAYLAWLDGGVVGKHYKMPKRGPS